VAFVFPAHDACPVCYFVMMVPGHDPSNHEHETLDRWLLWHWQPFSDWKNEEYDVVHFLLAIAYLAMMLYASFMFYRYQYHSKLFMGTFAAGASLRMVFFFLSPFIKENVLRMANSLTFLMNTLPSVLLLSTYMSIIFFWGQLYRSEASVLVIARQPNYFSLAVNVLMYLAVAVLYALDIAFFPKMHAADVAKPHTPYEEATQLFVAGMYVSVSVGFFLFGWFTYRKTWQENYGLQPHRTRFRRSLLNRVGKVTLICMSAFVVRAAITTWSAFVDISLYWWVDPLYYTVLELVPMFLILNAYLRKRGEPFGDSAMESKRNPSGLVVGDNVIISSTSPLIQARSEDESK
jgi:THH1/TOM1/TOM3 domain